MLWESQGLCTYYPRLITIDTTAVHFSRRGKAKPEGVGHSGVDNLDDLLRTEGLNVSLRTRENRGETFSFVYMFQFVTGPSTRCIAIGESHNIQQTREKKFRKERGKKKKC